MEDRVDGVHGGPKDPVLMTTRLREEDEVIDVDVHRNYRRASLGCPTNVTAGTCWRNTARWVDVKVVMHRVGYGGRGGKVFKAVRGRHACVVLEGVIG